MTSGCTTEGTRVLAISIEGALQNAFQLSIVHPAFAFMALKPPLALRSTLSPSEKQASAGQAITSDVVDAGKRSAFSESTGLRSQWTYFRAASAVSPDIAIIAATTELMRSDLIDDASALADQSLADTMQSLQVERISGLRRHELHCQPLHRLSDRLRVTEVVLLRKRV